ncbi:hypothetical protein ONS96_005288 [Cadophora gregata f. sp. sojae]|nr:hypothetical protein ONS96_005288 [Cadophora gregata f. sp. sojae]
MSTPASRKVTAISLKKMLDFGSDSAVPGSPDVLESWLKSPGIRSLFSVTNEQSLYGKGPNGETVVDKAVDVILENDAVYSQCKTKESRTDWAIFEYYVFFVTELVTMQRSRHGIWVSSGSTSRDIRKLCGIALEVLRYMRQQPELWMEETSQQGMHQHPQGNDAYTNQAIDGSEGYFGGHPVLDLPTGPIRGLDGRIGIETEDRSYFMERPEEEIIEVNSFYCRSYSR